MSRGLGALERYILDRLLDRIEDEELGARGAGLDAGAVLSAAQIAQEFHRSWPHRYATRAETVSALRAMRAIVRKFPQFALAGGKGRTPLYIYEPGNPQSVKALSDMVST